MLQPGASGLTSRQVLSWRSAVGSVGVPIWMMRTLKVGSDRQPWEAVKQLKQVLHGTGSSEQRIPRHGTIHCRAALRDPIEHCYSEGLVLVLGQW